MNIGLWIVQGLLALLCLSGGWFKFSSFAELAKQFPALSGGGWRAVGVLEMVLGVLLILPAATKWLPVLTPIAAAVLAVEALALAALYASGSLQINAQNPLVWAVVMAALAGFVAFGRWSLSPVV